MTERYDILVAGSGPAGASAAAVAAQAGLSVLLLDRAAFPRDKLCGGLFTGRSARALDRIFGTTPDPGLFQAYSRMRFAENGRILSDFRDAPTVYLTMRYQMDAWLRARALAFGAQARLGTLERIDTASRHITLRGGERLNYGVLIGADGVNSAVARALFGRAFDPRTIGFGLEIEAPPGGDNQAETSIDIDLNAVLWGYGWKFPKTSSTTIGVGGLHSRNPDMKARLNAYCHRIGVGVDTARIKGHFLPFGDFRRHPGRGAVLLAGDAAGLVDPITGEGIALAMESGASAARSAIAALASGRPGAAYARYRRALRPLHRDLAEARFWRRMIFSPALRPAFVRAFAGSSIPPRFLRLLAGEIGYRDLRRDLALRYPRAAVAALSTR